MSHPITSVSIESLKANLQTPDKVVLLDFWAPWCAPCRALAPTLERLAQEADERLSVLKINVDENPEIRRQFSIRGIPTLILLRGDVELARQSGNLSLQALRSWIQQQGVTLAASKQGLTPTPWGAFYGDPQLRDFLLSRLKQHAKKGELIIARSATWIEGRGTLCAALVHSEAKGVFERVSGLPSNLAPALDFFDITNERQVSNLFDNLKLNADTRHVAIQLLREWLVDAEHRWPQLLAEPELEELRLRWLHLSEQSLVGELVEDDKWQALHQSALERYNLAGDPLRELQGEFAKLLSCLSPIPADNKLHAWQAVFETAKHCNVHLLMQHVGWSAEERNTPALRNQWFEQREQEHGELSAEAIQAYRTQWNTENADFLAKEQHFHSNYLVIAARSNARHLKALAELLANAPHYIPL